MAVTWKIENVDVQNVGSYNDVVKKVYFACIEDRNEPSVPDASTIKSSLYRHHIEIGDHDTSNFTSFADLTEDQIVNWVKATLGDDHVKFLEDLVVQGYDDNPLARSTSMWAVYTPTKDKELPF